MLRRILLSVVALAIAFVFSRQPAKETPILPFAPGRNNTVLFLTTELNGLSNVHVATTLSLLENHPEIEVHYASFPKLADKISRVSASARAKNPSAKPIVWHEMPGLDLSAVFQRQWKTTEDMTTQQGALGMQKKSDDFSMCIAPWEAEEHLALFRHISALIDEVDPAVVVLEMFLSPSRDIARNRNRRFTSISPNGFIEIFAENQPAGAILWKYPLPATGFPFPLPWYLIPTNIYIGLRFGWNAFTSSYLASRRKYLAEQGIEKPIELDMAMKGLPLLMATFPEANVPMETFPETATFCGVVAIDVGPAAEQDAVLTAWLKRAPTVLINLGSLFKYNQERTSAMVGALQSLLSKTDIQVLWKYRKHGNFSDDIFQPMQTYLDDGRLRIEDWLNVDPLSLLKTGDIVVSVHHGGANCYHEAVLAGVPQVILPTWHDLYSFAVTAEYLGIGIWPGKDTAPAWEAETLAEGFLEAVVGGRSVSLREKAKALGEVAATYGGRDTAAAEVAKWASIPLSNDEL